MPAPHIQPFLSKRMPTGIWNPSDKDPAMVLSNNNLTVTCSDGSPAPVVRGIVPHSAGKWYFEVTNVGSYVGFITAFGITTRAGLLSGSDSVTVDRAPALLADKGGIIYFNNAIVGNYGGNFSVNFGGPGTLFAAAIDLDNMLGYFRYENTPWNWSSPPSHADPATAANGIDISSLFSNFAAYPCFCTATAGDGLTANFGATSFVQAVPSGFSAWG